MLYSCRLERELVHLEAGGVCESINETTVSTLTYTHIDEVARMLINNK